MTYKQEVKSEDMAERYFGTCVCHTLDNAIKCVRCDFKKEIAEAIEKERDKTAEWKIKHEAEIQVSYDRYHKIAALEAELLRCKQALKLWVDVGDIHDHHKEDCPKDDTCNCPIIKKVNLALGDFSEAIGG